MQELMQAEGELDVLQGGDILPVVFHPDPTLKTKCLDVPEALFGAPELHKLAMDMAATMYMTGGVGLSAPQVGIPWRMFVMDIHANLQDKKPMLLTFLNPKLIDFSKETIRLREGCISFPGVREDIERSAEVTIEALDTDGNPIRLRAGGWVGRIMQHEVDHLDGILMIDRMGKIARRQAAKKLEKIRRSIEAPAKKKAKVERKTETRKRKKAKSRGK